MNDNNATDDEELSADEAEAFRQLIEQQVALIAGALMEFTNLPEDKLHKHAAHVAAEQMNVVQQIVPTMTREHEATFTHKRIGVKLRAPNGKEIISNAPKRLEDVKDPGEAIHWAFITSLLFSPQVRACLSAYGFQYAFVQMKVEEKPKIIL